MILCSIILLLTAKKQKPFYSSVHISLAWGPISREISRMDGALNKRYIKHKRSKSVLLFFFLNVLGIVFLVLTASLIIFCFEIEMRCDWTSCVFSGNSLCWTTLLEYSLHFLSISLSKWLLLFQKCRVVRSVAFSERPLVVDDCKHSRFGSLIQNVIYYLHSSYCGLLFISVTKNVCCSIINISFKKYEIYLCSVCVCVCVHIITPLLSLILLKWHKVNRKMMTYLAAQEENFNIQSNWNRLSAVCKY